MGNPADCLEFFMLSVFVNENRKGTKNDQGNIEGACFERVFVSDKFIQFFEACKSFSKSPKLLKLQRRS